MLDALGGDDVARPWPRLYRGGEPVPIPVRPHAMADRGSSPMAVMLMSAMCLVLTQVAVAQYGPLPSSRTRHRTTTTTAAPDTANEVLPPSPYQPPPGYRPQGSGPPPHTGTSYPTPPGQPPSQYPVPQYPSPSGQPQQPTTSNQPPPQYPSRPSSQYPKPSGQPQYPSTSGQPSPQYPASGSGQPSPQYPTPSGQPQYPSTSGQPSPQYPTSGSGQPSSQYPTPSGQPQYPSTSGQPSPQYPTSGSGQPSPQYPTPSGQPQYPSTSGQPSPQYPTSGSGQPSPQYPTPSGQPQYPSTSGQPSPQYPTSGSGQPSPQYPTPSGQQQYPSPSGQPSSQYPSHSSGKPTPQYPSPSGGPSPSSQPSSQYPTPSGQTQYPSSSSGQPSSQYPTPSSGQPSSQYPTPSGQPQYPSPSGQPSSQYPTSGSGQPSSQYPTSSGQPSPPDQPSSQNPTPSGKPQNPPPSSQPSSQYPTISSSLPASQQPTISEQSYPSKLPSSQYPTPSGQPLPSGHPQYPTVSGQPQYPFPPSSQGTPQSTSDSRPSPFPSAQPSPFKPPSSQLPVSPGQTPLHSKPQYSPQPVNQVGQFWWANPQNPFKAGVRPTSAAPLPPAPGFGAPLKPAGPEYTPNLNNNPFISGSFSKPEARPTSFGPPNRPGFPPQPQQPLPSPSRPQPGYGQPVAPLPQPHQNVPLPKPEVKPILTKPNPINPNNPFLNNGIQKPVREEIGEIQCNIESAFCVPNYQCNNGIVADPASLTANLKKGPCSPGEVCCKVKKPTSQAQSYSPHPGQFQPYAVTEAPKYTGPLNTTPYPGCPAALKCVDVSYCTAEGVMSNTPVTLTREQTENRVPLTDCQDMSTGILGKCCRDPNYKDPWPAGMMMPTGPKNFDDGQYHPLTKGQFDDGQYHPSPEKGEQEYTTFPPPNPHTIKLPIGVFNQKVTPFPIAPRPGQTHEQVFPGNQDKLFGTSAPLTPHHVAPHPGFQQPQHPSYQDPSQQLGPYPGQPGQQHGSSQHPGSQPGQPLHSSIQPQSPLTSSPAQYFYQQTSPKQNSPYQPQPPQQPSHHQQTGETPQPQQKPQEETSSKTQPQPTPEIGQNPSPQTTPGDECGVRGQSQSENSDEAGFGEFPWHAVISSSNNNSALCSAAIIAPNAVITSAHCIEGLSPEDIQIKAGGYTLGQEGPKPAQLRKVGAAAVHPSYNSGSLVKDQAIVVTEEPLLLDDHINKVCLPPTTEEEYTPTGGDCYVTGYGRPSLQRNTPGSKLHKVKVNLIPKEQCESNLKKTHLGKYFILNKGFTCAAPLKEADLCKVDVGSPLVCEKPDGRFELAGVYSWDTKCSTALPGVMASCDSEWIHQVLATPIEKLREQYARPQVATHLIIDIDTKPGFALGYGK